MKFTNTDRNMGIELIDQYSCKITLLDSSSKPKQLEIMCRLLSSYERRAPLEGGSPIQFQYNLDQVGNCILITGNVMNAMRALCDMDFISDSLRSDIVEQVALDTLKQAINNLPVERQEGFIDKIRTQAAADSQQGQYSAALFS